MDTSAEVCLVEHTVNYCGISGGKDSQAVLLWMIHESGYERESLRFSFCDTENEHRLTYEHIEYLSDYSESHGGPRIVTLKPERGFFDLAKWKGRFPTRKARFCTQHLKVIPSRNDVMKLLAEGHEVVLHSGVRREEAGNNPSHPRANLPERDKDTLATGWPCEVYRPILHWTTTQVFEYIERWGVKWNPLYDHGARRVGCLPCINSRKSEVAMIARDFPEVIDRLRIQERLIGKISMFFARKTVPERFRSYEVDTRKGKMKVATIDDVVAWSQTGKGAIVKSGELFPIIRDPDKGLVCPSGMGMCE